MCLGNICRSPLAEGVFRELVQQAGLQDRFLIDSAGTSGYHTGEGPDPRTSEVAARRGIILEHASRRLRAADLERFDFILAMDRENLGRIETLAAGDGRCEIGLLRAYDESAEPGGEVPDPYYSGASGFEDVHDMVERACRGLLFHIRAAHGV